PAFPVTCTVAATGMAFGTYNPFASSPQDTTATITVTCITLVSTSEIYTVKLSAGGAGSYSRRLTSGIANLNYNVYTDPAHSSVWGDGTNGTSYQTFSGTLPVGTTNTNFTAYGRMVALQSAQMGTYADSLVVTVNF